MASLFETEEDVRAIQEAQARQNANTANPRMTQDPINDIRSQVRANASNDRRSGGNLIGAGIDRSGLLGDSITLNPQMKKATDMRQIQSEAGERFEPSTPEYFGFVASEMSNRGYHGEAAKAQEYGLTMEQKRASIDKDKASAYASRNPKAAKITLNDFIDNKTGKAVNITDAAAYAANAKSPDDPRYSPVPKAGSKPKMSWFHSDTTGEDEYISEIEYTERKAAGETFSKTTTAKPPSAKEFYYDKVLKKNVPLSVDEFNNAPSGRYDKATGVVSAGSLSDEDKASMHTVMDESMMNLLPEKLQAAYSSDVIKDPVKRQSAIIKQIENQQDEDNRSTNEERQREAFEYSKLTDVEKMQANYRNAKTAMEANPEDELLAKEFAEHRSVLEEKTGYTAGDNNGMLTEEAIELFAQDYILKGKAALPPMRGELGTKNKLMILNRVGKIATETGQTAHTMNLNSITRDALSAEKKRIMIQKGQIASAEQTAHDVGELAIASSAKVGLTGSPLINKGIVAVKMNITGDEDMAVFNMQNETLVTEYAKIMSGAMGNTVTAVSATEHAREMLNRAFSPETYKAVVERMFVDMDLRMKSLKDELQNIDDQVLELGNGTSKKKESKVTDINKMSAADKQAEIDKLEKELGGTQNGSINR